MDYFVPQDYQPEVWRQAAGPRILQERINRIVVLVGRPGLGDLVLSLPFFQTLFRQFPTAEVTYVGDIPEFLKELFSLIPNAKLFYFPCLKGIRSLPHWFRLWKKAWHDRIDLVIDTQRYFLPSLCLRLVRAKYHLGYSSRCFFSRWKFRELDRANVHDACQTLVLLRVLGVPEIDLDLRQGIPGAYLKAAEEYLVQHSLNGEKLVAFLPAAGLKFKEWPAQHFRRLGELLTAEGLKILLLGNSAEEEYLANLVRDGFLVPGLSEPVFPREPLASAALLRFCRFAVANDCGGSHLAALAGIPVVTIFGPTAPGKFAPLGKRNLVFYRQYPCSPCGQNACGLERRCLTEITPEEVFEEIRTHYLEPKLR